MLSAGELNFNNEQIVAGALRTAEACHVESTMRDYDTVGAVCDCAASGEMSWHAIRTKRKHESRAEQNLRASEFETFAPSISERSPLKIGTQTGYRHVPLFPGYIFARFVPDRHLWRVRSISGVQDVVTFGNAPARVDDDVIALLHVRVAEMATRGAVPLFVPGEHVMIQDGPLRNLVGIFEREMNGCERVAVLLSTIHWRARTVVDLRSLAKVNAR